MTEASDSATTPYEQFGGHDFFAALVHAFYERVALDPILRPMYPPDDLAGAEDRLRMFLEQYWGGPTTYNELRGHPKLRMRHMAFPIDAVARDRWLTLMHDSMVEQRLPEALETQLWTYFVSAAFAMQNIVGDQPDELPVTEA